MTAPEESLRELCAEWLGWFDGDRDDDPPWFPERRIEIADHLRDVRQLLAEHAAATARVAELDGFQLQAEGAIELLADLADPDSCHYDHHGGCQAHGYLSLANGEQCPHSLARAFLAAARPSAGCPCGCVPGQPCGCGLEDCECVDQFTSGCPICDRDGGE